MVEPASLDIKIYTIHGDDFSSCKEAVEEETDDAANRVLREEIERIVDAYPVLDLCAVVAHCAGDDAEDDRCPDRDVPRRRGRSDETSDRTGTETDSRVLPLQTEIELGRTSESSR